MQILHDILLAIHFAGLFLGGASGVALPIVGRIAAGAPVDQKPAYGKLVKPLQKMGKIGMGLLIVTGIVLATMGGVWTSGNAWFWIKMVGLAGLLAGIVTAEKAGERAMAGDAAAGAKMPRIAHWNHAMLAVILLSASFAFH